MDVLQISEYCFANYVTIFLAYLAKSGYFSAALSFIRKRTEPASCRSRNCSWIQCYLNIIHIWLQLADYRPLVEQRWDACWEDRLQLQSPESVNIAAETDLRSDWLLGSELLYHVDLSFKFILKPRYFFLSCRRPWREDMAGTHVKSCHVRCFVMPL